MTSFLGPETPRPFAVISEFSRLPHATEVRLPRGQSKFGAVYDKHLFSLLHKYLEVDTTDRICFVGEGDDEVAFFLHDRFCLSQPVHHVSPLPCHPGIQPDIEGAPVLQFGIGAERFFAEAASQSPHHSYYDKIVMMDCMALYVNRQRLLANVVRTLSDGGKLLIVHRPIAVNSLPLFRSALLRAQQGDVDVKTLLNDINGVGMEFTWELENVKAVMPKAWWIELLAGRQISYTQYMSDIEILQGLRELQEGVFKYEGAMVEFTDRLFMVTASKPAVTASLTRAARKSSLEGAKSKEDLKLRLLLTEEYRKLLFSKK